MDALLIKAEYYDSPGWGADVVSFLWVGLDFALRIDANPYSHLSNKVLLW